MSFELQPRLGNALVRVQPLAAADFPALYAVASDPLVWEQHPSPTRYQEPVFANYFQGALASGGALLVFDATTDALIGSSRYYDLDEGGQAISIGYTFIARSHWGRGYNRALKVLMLDHAFRFVTQVLFQVGAGNRRSRIAMARLGATQIGEAPVSYYGEASNLNVIYRIGREHWPALRAAAGAP
jgi:RimJ/RimL family protein N-acetyltransferase